MVPLVIEQVAHCVSSVARSVDLCKLKYGAERWVQDSVKAVHLYLHPDLGNMPNEFQVHLAFNYDLMPGMELELIELVSGFTAQLNPLEQRGPLSHYGFHVTPYREAEAALSETLDELPERLGEHDPLTRALKDYQEAGYKILQVSQTIGHLNTARRYRYAFVDCRADLGIYLKIIQRVPKTFSWAEGLVRGQEEFAWLNG